LVKEFKLDSEGTLFLNLIFKDRLLRFLEREGILKNCPTEEAEKIVRVIREWKPDEDDLPYILCKLFSLPTNQKDIDISNESKYILDIPINPELKCLTPKVRDDFLSSDPVWLFYSKDFGFQIVIAKKN